MPASVMSVTSSALNFTLSALRGAKQQRPQMPLAPGPHGAASRGHQQGRAAFSLFAGEPAAQGPFSFWPGPDPAPQGPFSFIRPDLPPVEGERGARARAAPASVEQQDQSFGGKLSSGGKQRFRSALEQVSYLTNQSAQGLE